MSLLSFHVGLVGSLLGIISGKKEAGIKRGISRQTQIE